MKPTRDQEILSQVIQKAWEDESFKKQLIENPADAIASLTGESISLSGRKLIVRDQTDPDTIFINIPVKKNAMDDAELSEDQLDHVSGGGDPDPGNLFPTPRGNG